jgi:hypothetical protein
MKSSTYSATDLLPKKPFPVSTEKPHVTDSVDHPYGGSSTYLEFEIAKWCAAPRLQTFDDFSQLPKRRPAESICAAH